jgi:hypothetical protein
MALVVEVLALLSPYRPDLNENILLIEIGFLGARIFSLSECGVICTQMLRFEFLSLNSCRCFWFCGLVK